MPQYLLVVEDDDLQRSVLKSALEHRGYRVDIAADGLTAVRMLRTGGYDLALMDYHLPEMDGFASARLVRELMDGEARPKLIALTFDSERLSNQPQANGVFDEIVPKRLELATLVGIIDSHLRDSGPGRRAREAEMAWQGLGRSEAPAALVLPSPTPEQAPVLRACFDLTGHREPELVLLAGPQAAAPAALLRGTDAKFTLPFVDLNGGFGHAADAAFSATDTSTWAGVAQTLARFAERRAQLRPEILAATDLETRLLAYAFVAGRTLHPMTDPASRRAVRYPGLFAEEDAWRAAERLAASGLLDRHFIDRTHCCPRCGSGRLSVRSECPSCRSTQLRSVALVRHLRCGHQAPEDTFARGVGLVCPKCHQALGHLGTDHERPGHTLACADCGAVNEVPMVGYCCMDCGAHADRATAPQRDIFAYAINSEGVLRLTSAAARGTAGPVFAIGEVPFALRDALRRPEPIVFLAEIGYCPGQRIVARRGGSALRSMRRLFLEQLMIAIDGSCEVFMDDEKDFLLVRRSTLVLPQGLTREILDDCQKLLTEPMYPDVRRLDPMAAAEVG